MPWIHLNNMDAEAVNKALAELDQDSDRAAGIVGAVFVEEALTALIQSRISRNADLIHEMFRNSGPLGAFSVKITMGFLMGLYSEPARRELETIKDIRNQFAHYHARSFEFDRIKSLSGNLTRAETTDFYLSHEGSGKLVLWMGGKPTSEHPSVPVLDPIEAAELTARRRYLRSCQFYSAALLFASHALVPIIDPTPVFI